VMGVREVMEEIIGSGDSKLSLKTKATIVWEGYGSKTVSGVRYQDTRYAVQMVGLSGELALGGGWGVWHRTHTKNRICCQN